VAAHQYDVNAVRFVDNSNSLIVSGSDDNLVCVWDRRALNESQPKPVGIFAGHSHGITFVHSRVSDDNADCSAKDIRLILRWIQDISYRTVKTKVLNCGICVVSLTSPPSSEAIRSSTNLIKAWTTGMNPMEENVRIDQRSSQAEIVLSKHLAAALEIPGDPSVRTYRGHCVRYTLIRCFFSPAFSTGQKYIVTGSSDGGIRSSYRLSSRMSIEFEFSFCFFPLRK
jgi:DDB1- and CUL4-associated factor 11